MPIPVPPLRFTPAAEAHAAAGEGLDDLRAQVEAELRREFETDADEPVVDDLLRIFFHTFVARDGREFLLSPDGEAMRVDLCVRRAVEVAPGTPARFRRLSMPEPYTKPDPDVG